MKPKEREIKPGRINKNETKGVSELAKSNFLARMSHEMRTPLNAIIGMSTIAQTSNDIEKIAECLVKINEASVHLLGIINDVLDMAKIESGNLVLRNAEFNLLHMLRKTAEKIQFTLDAKKQNLITDFDPDLPETVSMDEQKFTQVLDNLLSNAVKFTPPEGTITFSVKKTGNDSTPAGSDEASDRYCKIEVNVIDTGIGISEKGIKKIFDIFEQAEGGLDRKYAGAGIGLAISSCIVRKMNGNIQVESRPGKGSRFSFIISVEKGSAGSEKMMPKVNAVEQGAKFKGYRILLVEDVEINREIVLSLLEDTGIGIDCAENGLRAVEMYRTSPKKYSAILMDVHMPEMDGYEATRQIRIFEAEQRSASKANASPEIPIIAMTANVFKEDVDKCIEAGMTSHLGKPIDLEELIKKLDTYLTRP